MKKKLFLKSGKLHFILKNFFRIGMLPVLVVFITISCTKNDAVLKDDLLVENAITLHDGRLIFKDSITFMNHVKWIHENQGNSKEILDKNCSWGFKSMTEYYKEGMKIEEDNPKFIEFINKYPNVFYKVPIENSTIYELPHSIVVCYCANKDGILQIGTRIIRIGWEHIYEIKDGDESKIDMLFLPKDQIRDNAISISPSIPKNRISQSKDNLYGSAIVYFSDTKYRIYAKLWEYTLYGVWWDDAETIAQKKTLGVWFKANLNTRTARNNGYFACTGCYPYTIYPDYDENNYESRLNIVFTDTQIDMEESFCPVYQRGRYNGQYIYAYWADALDATPSYTTPTSAPF